MEPVKLKPLDYAPTQPPNAPKAFSFRPMSLLALLILAIPLILLLIFVVMCLPVRGVIY